MHKIEKRAVVIDDEIVIRPMMYLALSYDHRIVDGKEAVTPPPPPPTNQAPSASATAPMSLEEFETAVLDATSSTDADGDTLTFSWEQISGVSVTLINANMASASFTAPDVAEDETLSFRVTVSDGTTSSTATVDTTIMNFLAADEVPDVFRFSAAEDELNGFINTRGATFTLTADAATR